MKKILILLNLALLLLLWSSCSRDCPNTTVQTKYVDKSYLPDVIPYSDTSTARFLKNGKDTLLFKSQGLKETFISGSELVSECPKSYKLQQYSLRMAASDSDFFEMKYYASTNSSPRGKFSLYQVDESEIDDIDFRSFRKYYPPIISLEINGYKYDTVSFFTFVRYPSNPNNAVYIKPGIGFIKILSSRYKYELIK